MTVRLLSHCPVILCDTTSRSILTLNTYCFCPTTVNILLWFNFTRIGSNRKIFPTVIFCTARILDTASCDDSTFSNEWVCEEINWASCMCNKIRGVYVVNGFVWDSSWLSSADQCSCTISDLMNSPIIPLSGTPSGVCAHHTENFIISLIDSLNHGNSLGAYINRDPSRIFSCTAWWFWITWSEISTICCIYLWEHGCTRCVFSQSFCRRWSCIRDGSIVYIRIYWIKIAFEQGGGVTI